MASPRKTEILEQLAELWRRRLTYVELHPGSPVWRQVWKLLAELDKL